MDMLQCKRGPMLRWYVSCHAAGPTWWDYVVGNEREFIVGCNIQFLHIEFIIVMSAIRAPCCDIGTGCRLSYYNLVGTSQHMGAGYVAR
jgi:hypothetical protein